MWFFKSEPKKHTASMPTGRKVASFTPLIEFKCAATDTVYVIGQTYHVREGNGALAARCEKWISEGKIQWL